jgi:hypothetical protein
MIGDRVALTIRERIERTSADLVAAFEGRGLLPAFEGRGLLPAFEGRGVGYVDR